MKRSRVWLRDFSFYFERCRACCITFHVATFESMEHVKTFCLALPNLLHRFIVRAILHNLPFVLQGCSTRSVGVEFIFHNCDRGAGYGCTGPSCHGYIADVDNCGWLGPVAFVLSTGETRRWPLELEVVSGCGCLQRGIRFHRRCSELEWVAHLERCSYSRLVLLVPGFGFRGSLSIQFHRLWCHCRWSSCTGSCRHGKYHSCRT